MAEVTASPREFVHCMERRVGRDCPLYTQPLMKSLPLEGLSGLWLRSLTLTRTTRVPIQSAHHPSGFRVNYMGMTRMTSGICTRPTEAWTPPASGRATVLVYGDLLTVYVRVLELTRLRGKNPVNTFGTATPGPCRLHTCHAHRSSM